jgi:DNA-binding response OmpR family regulator
MDLSQPSETFKPKYGTASLEALGYQVRQPPKGRSGLAVLEESRPDLVVLDFACLR